MMRWLVGISDSMDMRLKQATGDSEAREAWHAIVSGVAKSRTQVSY